MSLGENIIRLRGEKSLSQEKLAMELGVSRQAISKWETDASVPELDKLLRMSELFGVSLDALVKGVDKRAEEKTNPPERRAVDVPPVRETVIMERRGAPLRVTLGIFALCFGALLLFVLLLCGGATDFLAVGFLVMPLVLVGVIALSVRENTLLWCGWVLWCYFMITCRWMVGVRLSLPALLIALFALCPCTLLAFKNRKK